MVLIIIDFRCIGIDVRDSRREGETVTGGTTKVEVLEDDDNLELPLKRHLR